MAREKVLSPKQVKFIDFYMQGFTQSESAFRAGLGTSKNSSKVYANQLMNKPEYAHVQDEIKRRQLEALENAGVSLETHIKSLKSIRDRALSDKNYSSAVKSEELIGRVSNLYQTQTKTTIEHIHSLDLESTKAKILELQKKLSPYLEGEVVEADINPQ